MADGVTESTELPDYMRIRDRPLGVSILGGLHLLGGLLMLAPLAMFISNSEQAKEPLQEIGIPLWLLIAGICLLSLVGLLSGIGMFIGKKWGWWLAAFYYVYSIGRHGNALFLTYQLADLDDGGGRSVSFYRAKFAARILIAFLLLVYLFRGRVLQYFGLESTGNFKRIGTLVGICVLIACLVNGALLLTASQ
jgi:hypothetical protein